MSEITSVVETQQQQYVSGGNSTEHHCKDCGVNFESEKSLEVHLHYHQENLLNRWANKAQQEESNNNHSKAGNHNSHVNANRDSVTMPADSSEPSSMSPSQEPASSQQQQQQQQPPPPPPQQQQSQQQAQQQQPQTAQQQQQPQQPQQQAGGHSIVCQSYEHYQPIFPEGHYFIQNEQYMLPQHFSPQSEDAQSNGGRDGGGAYSHYSHLYPHQQHYAPERAVSNSTSPRSTPLQCDKCGAVYEDANKLGDHMRTVHLDSPSAYSSGPQYQPLGSSPQQSQQLHSSPPLSSQPPQQSNYDYNGGQPLKTEMKQEPEEQTEILDLDSHKVQTHRFEQEFVRLQQQQQQQQMQIHHQQVMQQQQRIGAHSVIGWQPAAQTHDYHVGLSPMTAVDNVPPIADQSQFMRSQHIPVEHGHQNSPIITSTQSMTNHQMTGFVQQPPKAPPLGNQTWKSNEARRPKTYNCTACSKWFTSSGHLKRHYNTTLHKNAVKNGKEPDPATLPISVHHHPTRENNGGSSTSGRSGSATARSPPDLSSSRSPPNLMAGPSGEATGGLLHTPTTLCSSSNNNSSSNSDCSAIVQQQQQQQQILVHLPHSGIIPLNSPGLSPLTGHHQQQMGSVPHQLALQQQQQQQQLHLPTGSPGQPVHHTTSHSPMPPPPTSHMNCPSPMRSSSHPHHMNPPLGSVNPAMTSSTGMEGTTMPHQPYPNALPPHVITTTSIPAVLLESIQPVTTIPLTIIGNKEDEQHQSEHQENMLPGFGTFEQKVLPNFTRRIPFDVETGFVVEQNQIQTVNVGGLNAEEITPQEASYESSSPNYDMYSSSRYKSMNTEMQSTDNRIEAEESEDSATYGMEQLTLEANNNHLAKEDMDPNVGVQPKKERKTKSGANKERQITTGAHYISQDGFHKCIDCDKIFNKACYLTQHNKSFHSGDKPFKCAQCGKRFHNEDSHGKHILMHGMTRKHQCDSCPKIFAHRTDLKRHLCIHTGLRPFKCKICNKGFIRQDHMKKHEETHKKKARITAQRLELQRLTNRRIAC